MGDQQHSKGEQLMLEAEALLNQSGGRRRGKKARERLEEARKLCIKAAKAFKKAKEWEKAGEVFTVLATLDMEKEDKSDSAELFVEAAECLKNVGQTWVVFLGEEELIA